MSTNERPVVETESGSVRGVVEGAVAAFRGVPYAASPVGVRRFAAPAPHPGWPGVRDAARPGPAVPQDPSRLEAVMGTRVPDWAEDGSLTVNVWAPRGAQDRPVLVWFHGGGFTSGSGGWSWYDGGRLAAAGDVVVVTANYRLGPLGYLHLPEEGVENLGVRDQAAVLGWVRRNIAAFGGDPRGLTVGGQSAGAFSALYLALDPLTGPLVDRVITQSGPWGLAPQDPGEAAERSRRLLALLGVTGAAALREVPADRLLAAYRELAGELSRAGDVAPPLYPVLGGFGVPERWERAVAAGRLDGKALLTGTTEDEMTAFFAFDPRVRALTFEQARALAGDRAGRFDQLAAAGPAAALTGVATERFFRDGTTAIADHHAAAGHPAYVYQFDRSPDPDPQRLGAAHCAELPFFFDTLDAYPDSPMLGAPSPAARELARTFSRAAASFTATGRPEAPDWQPYRPGDQLTVRHFG
ncbi:carboxylesterase/lipase family protein [Kitasatospora viridis]|uniref:Carboxylic ester hydrolase n=1 Tax=Kitasatospora viridis TaxID=281105 RepID=A0A561T6U0_9ACTN|nr:carboxylesterase family protein [Kitasatospora viridis]TWF82824.1 para-nitrobenzyl esterase [Kitasatospora viridis]